MAQTTQQQLEERYYQLPEDLRAAISGSSSSETIYNSAKTNGVLNGAIEIAQLVGEVLLGILPPRDFEKTIEKKVGIEKTVAQKIAEDIDQQIFSRVRQSLSRLYEKPAAEVESRIKKIEEKLETLGGANEPQMKDALPKETQTKIAPSKDIYREPVEEKKSKPIKFN